MNIYLAGAIRDGNESDIQWREKLVAVLGEQNPPFGAPVTVLNPLAGDSFNVETRKWSGCGRASTAKAIYKRDLWYVRQADLIVANLTSLAEGYPSVGTLMELGVAVGMGRKMIALIVPKGYKGHENAGMYALHPFLAESAMEVFETPEELTDWLVQFINVATGLCPQYGGTVGVEI